MAELELPSPDRWPSLLAGIQGPKTPPAPTRAPPARPLPPGRPADQVKLPLKLSIDVYLSQISVKPATKTRYRTVLDRLVSHFGASCDLATLNQDKFVGFADKVNADAELAIKSKQVTITAAATFINWHASRNSAIPHVTSASLKPKRLAPSWSDRADFSLEDMTAIFRCASANRRGAPHEFWVTIGCALTGCRLEELAQLHVPTDLKQHPNGIWYLDLNERPDPDGIVRKSLKKLSSWRVVPIHPLLAELGFVEFLRTEARSETGRPFSSYWAPHGELIPEDATALRANIKWSHKISKWGGRRLRELQKAKLIAPGNATYFHSMRHTFITTLAKAGVPEPLRAALTGHDNGGINGQIYTKFKDDPTSTFDALVMGASDLVATLHPNP
ncbi:site-specific integrase [Cupriavidus sp. BIS7]|uniref:site-specific integrase n=1 Tax=Cupriavidus sp. BIS7 TaxID=1217718 RepID=UPI0012F6A691|nr:site-specific integrase [Cupriavidus sp. BIS7]